MTFSCIYTYCDITANTLLPKHTVLGKKLRISMSLRDSKILFILFMCTWTLAVCGQRLEKLSSTLLNFSKNNSMKYLTFVSNDGEDKNIRLFIRISMIKAKTQTSVSTRFISKDSVQDSEKFRYHQDNLVIVSTGDAATLETELKIMSKTKIMTAIFVIINPIREEETIENLKKVMRNLSENMFFYLFYEIFGVDDVALRRVISVQNNEKILVQPVEFDVYGIIVTPYDMEEMHIPCLTLSWSPYVAVSKCDPDSGQNCNSVGYLPELLNLVGKQLNFTWHCDAEPSGNWGVIPVSGPSNVSGVYEGIVGRVASGEYQFSLCQWLNMYARIGLFDFVCIGRGTQYLMVLVPKLPEYDSSLFTRPFTDDVWCMIGLVNVVIILCLIVSWRFSRLGFGKPKTSFRFVKSIAWLTYMLFIIYYGGALKMFFTTEVTVPFETQRQIMLAYPEWKMKFRKGNEKLFYNKAETSDDIVYKEYWDRAVVEPKYVKYETLEDGLQSVFEEQVAIHIDEGSLKHYFKNNPTSPRPKYFPSEGEKVGEYMIVSENSPLGPILNHGFRILCENGVVDMLDTKWKGKDLSDDVNDNGSASALNKGQVMVIFVVLCTTIIISICVLLGECLFTSLKGEKRIKRHLFHIKR